MEATPRMAEAERENAEQALMQVRLEKATREQAQAMAKQAQTDFERLRQEMAAMRANYERQLDELVVEGQQAEQEEERERAALEAQVRERDASIKKLQGELAFLKRESEVKTNLVGKLRRENEELGAKYTQQSARTPLRATA